MRFYDCSLVQLEQHIFTYFQILNHPRIPKQKHFIFILYPPFVTPCHHWHVPQLCNMPQAYVGHVRGKKKRFTNIYQSGFCQPWLAVTQRRRQPSIITSSLGGTERRVVRPASGVESEELREANVNNCKPIKITPHLSLDLYWVAFQFSSVRLSECLEGLGGLLERLSFTGWVFSFGFVLVSQLDSGQRVIGVDLGTFEMALTRDTWLRLFKSWLKIDFMTWFSINYLDFLQLFYFLDCYIYFETSSYDFTVKYTLQADQQGFFFQWFWRTEQQFSKSVGSKSVTQPTTSNYINITKPKK